MGSMASPYRRGPLRRRLLALTHRLSTVLHPLGSRIRQHRKHLWWVPMLPVRWLPSLRSPGRPWDEPLQPVPARLRTAAGVGLDPVKQAAAAVDTPLHDFFKLYPEVAGPMSHMWLASVTSAPRVQAAARRRARRPTSGSTHLPTRAEPTELRNRLQAEARRLGLSAIGVTAHDQKYTFEEYRGRAVGDRVVIGVLEQNYPSTQRVPSLTSERAALNTYAQLEDRMSGLADWLRAQGYAARAEGYIGESLYIAYAVQAGLGQLGLNGQLLTPHAGSRCRLHVLTTDAPLELDQPVDYGIEGVCDECQICVRRCPVGAIPKTRSEHRGVMKAKLNTKRCLPLMAQTAGCSICMKVCPVQRYGMNAVIEEFDRTGTVLGKDTDDLEGFDWPLDGAHYGPGERPAVPARVINPPGFAFDPKRTIPPAHVEQHMPERW